MSPDQKATYISEAIDKLMPAASYDASDAEVVRKVKEDILFLQDRIERMKSVTSPNLTTLKTYESMLESRTAVLTWLQQNGNTEEDSAAGTVSHQAG